MTDANDYDDPDWEGGSHVHNWRTYVTDEVRAMWHSFTPMQRHALGLCFEAMASREEWD